MLERLPLVPFTLQQAKACDVTRQALRQLVAAGECRRVLTGVYQRCEIPDTVENRARAAALIVPPYGVFCDRTAAWLHGVDAFRYRDLELLPPVDVVVLRDFNRLRRDGLVGGTRDLDPLDVTHLGPVAVTTPLRTALDLGCKLRRSAALAVLDQFLRFHELTTADLAAETRRRYGGRRGVIQLRQLVSLATGKSESPGESWIRLAIHDANLPAPLVQVTVMVEGREFRLDLAYPKHRVCIEYDGERFHSTPKQRANDEARRELLRRHKWTVIVVTKADLDRAGISRWTREIRDALAR